MNDEAEKFFVHVPAGQEYGPADAATLREWAMQGRVPAGAVIRSTHGNPSLVAWQHPAVKDVLSAPPTVQGAMPYEAVVTPDATGGLIPYKNLPALIGYYTSIGGLLAMFIPLIGWLVCIGAIVLGVLGLRAVRQNPARRGTAHAWVAILLGGFGLLVNIGMSVAIMYNR